MKIQMKIKQSLIQKICKFKNIIFFLYHKAYYKNRREILFN